jgi:hypothetical protein
MAEPQPSFIQRITQAVQQWREGTLQPPPPPDEEPDEGDAAARPLLGVAQAASSAVAAHSPQLFTFTGFLEPTLIPQPGREAKTWQLMYLDLQMTNWLLVENDGIVDRNTVQDEKVPGGTRDVIWTAADAAVGIGRGSQSVEARFLTGEFTRAADFLASPSGGTAAAATGVFCEAQSVGCCRPSSRRRP